MDHVGSKMLHLPLLGMDFFRFGGRVAVFFSKQTVFTHVNVRVLGPHFSGIIFVSTGFV